MLWRTDRKRCLLYCNGTWSSSYTIRTQCLLLLLSCLLVSVTSFSCPWPCEREQHCTEIYTSACHYGIVLDACDCCWVCGHGPGEVCGLQQGRCGSGLECVFDFPTGLSKPDRDSFPGECMFIANTTVNSTQTTEEASTSLPTTDTITEPPTNLSSTAQNTSCQNNPEDEDSQLTCQQKCSIDFCTSTTRHRICAATGLAYSRVHGRGLCQHTSCRACFLHVQPNCIMSCREYPNKRCLKKYYQCVRTFLFGSDKNTNDLIIRIDDPNIRNYTGRLMCYVPDVDSSR